jgi:ribosome-binding factor A
MRSSRMRRVDEAMRAVLSDAIAKQIKDPRVGFVTVTGVQTSPDLRHARVYVSVLGDEATRSASLDGLRSAHGFLQRRLAAELTLKHTPALTFQYDDSVDRGMRISQLLDETADEQENAPVTENVTDEADAVTHGRPRHSGGDH